jgi:hypothetical protein
MARSNAGALIALIASAAALAIATDPAGAWTHRRAVPFPQFYGLRYYSAPHPVRYYRVCGYGDCACLHSIALRTGARVWWDRYDACTG